MDMVAGGTQTRAMREVAAPTLTAGSGEDADPVSLESWLPWVLWAIAFALLSTLTAGLAGQPAVEVTRVAGLIVGTMGVTTIGALVVSRGQARLPGWQLVGVGLFWSSGLAAYNLVRLTAQGVTTGARVLIAIGDIFLALSMFGLVMLFLVVPNGRLYSPSLRPVVWVGAALMLFWVLLAIPIANALTDPIAYVNRPSLALLEGAELGPGLATVYTVGMALGVVWTVIVAAALITRFRSSHGEERQQLKWILLGCLTVVLWLFSAIPEPSSSSVATLQALSPGLALMTFGTALGFALSKYRLWDVDVVIRRSLVYGILWLAIAAVYVAVAAGFGLFARSRLPVEVAIVLTVLATLAFQPARRRLERVADRLVFRRHGTPMEALQTFGSSIGEAPRPRDIATGLADVTHRMLGVAAVKVEIDGAEPAIVGEWSGGEETHVPIAWGDESFGVVRCLPRRSEHMAAGDIALVEALASQAALTVSHARLASRMVTAQEIERRRIERNIHDGVQQDLATQIGQLALARSRANGDVELSASLERIQQEMQRTLSEIRDLAQGIHPSVLRDHGLYAAIEDRCSRLPVEVSIAVAPEMIDKRFSGDTETAAYFTVSEALANVVKHADASSVTIQIWEDHGFVRVEVSDDGTGEDAERVRTGSGITGLADRLRALGGELSIESDPGRGTSVHARLPKAAAVPDHD